MNIVNISKQKIFDRHKHVYAYELLFENTYHEEINFSTSLKDTAQLIMSSIKSKELDKLLGKKTLAFVNIDEKTLLKGIIDLLDEDRFILNLLEDIEITDKVLSKIIQYKKRGYLISIENFNASDEMISKFSRLFNYIDIIKVNTILSEEENLQNIIDKFKDTRVKLLAKNIEDEDDYRKYMKLGFNYFQGYFLDKPESIEIVSPKETAQFTILQLIKIIKGNDDTDKIEAFIKRQPDLSYKLIEFFNKLKKFDVKIESITQVITLLGRAKLLKWLMVYLYSELSTDTTSKSVLELALKRAENMEADANIKNKDRAYLAGMFSMLSSIFETDIKDLMHHIDMDKDITELVLENKGIFAKSFNDAVRAEKDYLKKMMIENFDRLDTNDLIYTLEYGGIDIDKSKI